MRLAASVLALSLIAGAPTLASPERTLERTFEHRAGQRIEFEMPVGELRVEGGKAGEVRLELEVECRWSSSRCEEILERLTIDESSNERRLRVAVEGGSNWGKAKLEIDATLILPKAAEAEIELGVGELTIRGLEGDLEVELGVGEVRVEMARAKVGSVSLDAGIGEAELRGTGERIEGRRSLLIGSEVYWEDGPGQARIEIEVGVGEITLRLD